MKTILNVIDKSSSGIGAAIGNVIWVVLAGFWIAIGHILSGVALCITIVEITFGIANFTMVPADAMPLGKRIVNQ